MPNVYETPDGTTIAPIGDPAYHSYRPGDRTTAEIRPINPRLVNLLGSFIGGTSAYALARLEFCLTFPDTPAPPLLTRLPDASERTLRQDWDRVEGELGEITAYLRTIESGAQPATRSSAPFRALTRVVRELDQYARALRWVMTVTQQDPND